ncbi:MAG: hypothetical protein PWQ53_91, partial [Bacteroidota bacterium]|nr:hypothetical protein [Bacteroidota bacterium]
DPGGARTLDPLIKSQLLYQLSYGVFLVMQSYNFILAGEKNLTEFAHRKTIP